MISCSLFTIPRVIVAPCLYFILLHPSPPLFPPNDTTHKKKPKQAKQQKKLLCIGIIDRFDHTTMPLFFTFIPPYLLPQPFFFHPPPIHPGAPHCKCRFALAFDARSLLIMFRRSDTLNPPPFFHSLSGTADSVHTNFSPPPPSPHTHQDRKPLSYPHIFSPTSPSPFPTRVTLCYSVTKSSFLTVRSTKK